jgi:hypothetical protein
MRDNKINDQDLSNVSGAGGFMGRKAKVYAISGTQFGFYHNDNFYEEPFMMIANGSEMEIDPDIHRGFEFGEAKFVDVYAARYAGRTSFIRVSEVRVEWQ